MATRPNVIFIMTDQQRADSLGCYGNGLVKTPNLDRMAKGGAQVDHAFVSSPLCVPSRCSMMTGRYPAVTRSHTNMMLMGQDEEHLPKVLQEQGYKLALIGKNHCFHPSTLRGWDFTYIETHAGPQDPADAARGAELAAARKEVFFNHAVSSAALPFPKEDFGTHRITEQALAFLGRASEADDPFFLWLSYPDPHPPYVIPAEMEGTYDPAEISLPPREPGDFADKPVWQWLTSQMMGLGEKSEDELRLLIARYYAMVTFVDEGVGRVLDSLESAGLAENTLVVFVSDHGDFLGEHSSVEKGPALYDALLHVPLLFYWPGKILPQRIGGTMVESIDLYPTILDYLNLSLPRGVQGSSLKPLLDGKSQQHKDEVFASLGLAGSARTITRDEAADVVVRRKREYDEDPTCRDFRWICPERRSNPGVMIRTREWKLVYYSSGEGELYNLRDDPDEYTNLYGRAEHARTAEALRAKLLGFMLESVDHRLPLGFDPELKASAGGHFEAGAEEIPEGSAS